MNIEYRGYHVAGQSMKTMLTRWLGGAMLAFLATAGMAETAATPATVEPAASTQTSGDASTAKSDTKVKAKSAAPKRAAGQRMVFDHLKTGFELLGYHKQVKCEECHIKGVFRGTPRECATCHAVGSRFLTATTMSPKHFQVGNKACDDCHVTSDWNSVNVHHDSGMTGKCNSCHDGTHATGEPPNHFPTQQASCDYCHTTYTWIKAYFDHRNTAFVGVTGTAGTSGAMASPKCSFCHNGTKAQGMGASHISIGNSDCVNCHDVPPSSAALATGTLATIPTMWKVSLTWQFPHASYTVSMPGGSANCAYCHNNVLEVGKGSNHVTTSGKCDLCHLATSDVRNSGLGFGTQSTVMSHAGITSGCTNCHNGQANLQALPTLIDHGTGLGITPAGSLVSKVAAHMTTSQACEVCHNTSVTNGSTFAITTMNHQGITSGCAACHDVGKSFQYNFATPNLVTKMANHIPTTAITNGAVCETCHSASTFTKPGGFRLATPNLAAIHGGITSGCSTCHESNQTLPQGITSSVNFGSGSVTTLVVRPGATVAGGPALGYDHPQTGDCSGCHNTIAAGGFAISVAGAGMPTGHFPTTQACSLCHSGGYGVGLSQMNHSGASTTCATGGCHDGLGFTMTFSAKSPVTIVPVGKATAGVTHITTSVDCGVCHKAAAPTITVATAAPTYTAGGSFKVSSYISDLHSYVSTTTCANCHSGATTYTGMVNVGTIAAAVGSLTTQPTNITGCATGTGTHGALGECTNCHQSKVIPSTATTGFCSVGLPSGHFPTTQSCTLCHAAGYALTKTKMDHTGITGTCNTCHSGQPFTVAGIAVTPVNPGSVNHIPLASGDCANCHVTSNIPVVTVSSNAPSYTVGAGFKVATYVANLHSYVSVSSCANCHDSGTTFTGMTPIQTIAASVGSITSTPASIAGCSTGSGQHGALGECVSCHTAGSIAMPSTASTGFCAKTVLPSGHLPTTQNCALCHAGGYGLNKSVMDHTGVTTCNACHSGQTFTVSGVSLTPVSSTTTGVTHMPFTASTDCATCHNAAAPIVTISTSTPSYTAGGTFRVASYVSTLHNYVATGTCAACHDSGGTAYTGLAKIQTVAAAVGSISSTPTTIAGCTANAGATHPATGGICNTCHTSTSMPSTATTGFCGASMMPSTHFAVTGACALCHTNGYGLGKTVMDHSGVSLASCNTCHSGSMTITSSFTPVSTSSVTHIPLASGDCVNCHSAASIPTKIVNATASYTAGGGFKVTSYVTNLHAYVSTSACMTCHSTSAAFTGMANVKTIAAAVGSITVNPTTVLGCTTGSGTTHVGLSECVTCHSAANTVIPSTGTTGFCAATTMPANHVPFTGSCATSCHLGGYALGKTVMDHTQASGTCVSCHAVGTAVSFYNTSPASTTANGTHIAVSNTTCSVCHTGTPPTSTVTSATQYNAGFKLTTLNLPTIHTYVSTSCQNCHSTAGPASYNNGAVTVKLQPSNHIPNPAGTACTICHTNAWPNPAVNGFKLTNANQMVHTGIVSCISCHSGTSYYTGGIFTIKTAPASLSGGVCGGSGAHPTPAECSGCHSDTTIPSAPPSAGFCKATSIPANHIPITGPGWTTPPSGCTGCHPSGTGVGSGVMSHTGVNTSSPTGCSTCHGATGPIAFYGVTPMWAAQLGSHISFGLYGVPAASSISCVTCHKSTGTAAGPVGGFAGTSSTRLLHNGVSSCCSGQCVPCHLSPGLTFVGGESIRKEPAGHQNGSQGISTSPTMPSCDVCHNHTTSGFP
jgi:hypothetical protein